MNNYANTWSQPSDGPSTPTTIFNEVHTKSKPIFNFAQNLDQPSSEAFYDNISLQAKQQMLQTSHINQLQRHTVEEEHFFAYSGIENQPLGYLVSANNNLARPTPTGVSEYVRSTSYNNLQPAENITGPVPLLQSSTRYSYTEESLTYARAGSSLAYCSTRYLLTNTNLQIPLHSKSRLPLVSTNTGLQTGNCLGNSIVETYARPFPTISWPYTNASPSLAYTTSGPSLQSSSLGSLPYSDAVSSFNFNHQTNTNTGPSLHTTNSGFSQSNANKLTNTNEEFFFPNVNSGSSVTHSKTEPSIFNNALSINNPRSLPSNLNSGSLLCNDPLSTQYTSTGPSLVQSGTGPSLFNNEGPPLGNYNPGSSHTNFNLGASLCNAPWSTPYTSASAGPSLAHGSTELSLFNNEGLPLDNYNPGSSHTNFNSEASLGHDPWSTPYISAGPSLLQSSMGPSLLNKERPPRGNYNPGSSHTNLNSGASLFNDLKSTRPSCAGLSFSTNAGPSLTYNSTWPSLFASTKSSITTFNSEPSLTHMSMWPSHTHTRTGALLYRNIDPSLTNYRAGPCYSNMEHSFSNTNSHAPLPNASFDPSINIQTETPLNVVNADHLHSSMKKETSHHCATSPVPVLCCSMDFEPQVDTGQRSERVFHFTGSSANNDACQKRSNDEENSSKVTIVHDESVHDEHQTSKIISCGFEAVETIGIERDFAQSLPVTSWDVCPDLTLIRSSGVDGDPMRIEKYNEDSRCDYGNLDILRVINLSSGKEELPENFNAVSGFIASALGSPIAQLEDANNEASVEVLTVVHLDSRIVVDPSFHSDMAKLIDVQYQPETRCKDSSALNLLPSIISQDFVGSQGSSKGLCNVPPDVPDIPNDSFQACKKFDHQAFTKPTLIKSCVVKVSNVVDELNRLKQKSKETNKATYQVAAKPAMRVRDCAVKVTDIFLDGTLDSLEYSKSPNLCRLLRKKLKEKLSNAKNSKSLQNLHNGLLSSIGSNTVDEETIKIGQKAGNPKLALVEPTDDTSGSPALPPALSAGLPITKSDCITAAKTIIFKPIATVPKTKSKQNAAQKMTKLKTIAAEPRTKSEPAATLKRKKLEPFATLPKSKRKRILAVPSDNLKPIEFKPNAVKPKTKGKSSAVVLANKLKQIAAMSKTKLKQSGAMPKTKLKQFGAGPKTKLTQIVAMPTTKWKLIAVEPTTKSGPIAALLKTNFKIQKKKLESNTIAATPTITLESIAGIPTTNLDPTAALPNTKLESFAPSLKIKLESIAAIPTTKFEPNAAAPITEQPVAIVPKIELEKVTALRHKNKGPKLGIPTSSVEHNAGIPKADPVVITELPPFQLTTTHIKQNTLPLITTLELMTETPTPIHADGSRVFLSAEPESDAGLRSAQREASTDLPECQPEVPTYQPSPLKQWPLFVEAAKPPVLPQPRLPPLLPTVQTEAPESWFLAQPSPLKPLPQFEEAAEALESPQPPLSSTTPPPLPPLPPTVSTEAPESWLPAQPSPLKPLPQFEEAAEAPESPQPPLSSTTPPPLPPLPPTVPTEAPESQVPAQPSPLKPLPQFEEAAEAPESPQPPLSSTTPPPLPPLPPTVPTEAPESQVPDQPSPLKPLPQFEEAAEAPESPQPPLSSTTSPPLPSLHPDPPFVPTTVPESWVPYQPSPLKPWPKFSDGIVAPFPPLTSLMPPGPLLCKGSQNIRGELVELRRPFVSDDPRENADNCAQGWDVLRFVSSEQESFREVRRRWGYPPLPNPNRDLTFRFKRFEPYTVPTSKPLLGDLQSLKGDTQSLCGDLRLQHHDSQAMHCTLQSTQNDFQSKNSKSQSEPVESNFAQFQADIGRGCPAPVVRQTVLPKAVIDQRYNIQARRRLTLAPDKNIVAQNSAFTVIIPPSGVSVTAGRNKLAFEGKLVAVKRRHSSGGGEEEPAAKRARLIPCTMPYARKLRQVESAVEICRKRLTANRAQSWKPDAAQLRRQALQQRQWERAARSEQAYQRMRRVLTSAVADMQLFRSFYQNAEGGTQNTFYLTEREAAETLEQDRYYIDMMRIYNLPKSSSKCPTSQHQP